MAMPSETDALVWGRASFLRGQLLNASFRTLVANVAERWYLENFPMRRIYLIENIDHLSFSCT
jgi:hypothetical protein